MTVSIIHALLRLLLKAFRPPGSRRRVCAPPNAPAPVQQALVRSPTVRPRSPYGLMDTLDGEGTALVRPYLLAYERQERQEERAARQLWRRVSLVLATDFGVDLDTRDVHAVGVAAW
ncbi:hypothetical protein HHL19_10230 [Streptomyces sp. R302]|uniref:hypothetical protein n=1 Tax=unclassified Streptomyces TaxID=2593676 RepID=UPI00145EBFF0|nr:MULTISPECIES: hypothetical protein [unclassified Streptomyces]NML50045.1 hypothetical protein [Streptomyces sp. R301]NML79036.1 hypothetical protein [Streptomyces sp. R302]